MEKQIERISTSEVVTKKELLQDDTDLIRDTLQGDPNAFGNLITKYQPRFNRLALNILKNPEEAEDAVQEAFMEAFRGLANFQHRSQFSTWLYSIVINHVRNRLRHQKTLRWIPLENNFNEDNAYQPLEIPETEIPLEKVLEDKLEAERVHKAVESLPLHYQSIFIMHYYNDLRLQDIAAQINRPLGTVKAYLHRARKMVTDLLKQ